MLFKIANMFIKFSTCHIYPVLISKGPAFLSAVFVSIREIDEHMHAFNFTLRPISFTLGKFAFQSPFLLTLRKHYHFSSMCHVPIIPVLYSGYLINISLALACQLLFQCTHNLDLPLFRNQMYVHVGFFCTTNNGHVTFGKLFRIVETRQKDANTKSILQ